MSETPTSTEKEQSPFPALRLGGGWISVFTFDRLIDSMMIEIVDDRSKKP